jgi:hypothetical protein
MHQKSNGVVNPHWSQSGSGTSFLPQCGLDLDPDPESKTHADPNFHVNTDPDPNPDWHQNNADPCAEYPKFCTC